MRLRLAPVAALTLLTGMGAALAQSEPFAAGPTLKTSANVKVYGSFRFAESISYDAERDLFVVPNAGIAQDVIPNDGYVSLS